MAGVQDLRVKDPINKEKRIERSQIPIDLGRVTRKISVSPQEYLRDGGQGETVTHQIQESDETHDMHNFQNNNEDSFILLVPILCIYIYIYQTQFFPVWSLWLAHSFHK